MLTTYIITVLICTYNGTVSLTRVSDSQHPFVLTGTRPGIGRRHALTRGLAAWVAHMAANATIGLAGALKSKMYVFDVRYRATNGVL
jgi:hypothetical protein